MSNKLEALLACTPDEQAKLSYPEAVAKRQELRCEAYHEHILAMIENGGIPRPVREWAMMMQASHGKKVMVWGQEYSSWLMAFMIVRYGEAPEKWPTKCTKEDVTRSQRLLSTSTLPAGVTVPAPEADTLEDWSMLLWLIAGLGGLLSILHDPMALTLALPAFATAMTDFLENKLIDNFFRTTTYTRPSVLGVALFTAAPGEAGGGTEVSGGSYARVDHPPLNTNWNATQGGTSGDSSGAGGNTTNATDITFPSPTGNWGVVSHWAIFDATSSGNMLMYGTMGTSKTVNNGDPAPKINAGDLSLTFA